MLEIVYIVRNILRKWLYASYTYIRFVTIMPNHNKTNYNNSFKDEGVFPISMTLDNEEQYSQNKKLNNICDISDILDRKFIFNDRGSQSLYFSTQIVEEWRRFCLLQTTMNTAELTEKVLIYAMSVIPTKNILIEIDGSGKNEKQSINDHILESECMRAFTKGMGKWLEIYEKEGKLKNFQIEYIDKKLRTATRVKVKTPEFEKMIEQVLTLLG